MNEPLPHAHSNGSAPHQPPSPLGHESILRPRRQTRALYLAYGPHHEQIFQVGGSAPISIQSMNTTKTANIPATLQEISRLALAGCDITRVAVPDFEAAEALKVLVAQSPIPVVADIHFDARLALAAIGAHVAALRINPGNIGGKEKIAAVAQAAKAEGIPIRVGVNAGSVSGCRLDPEGRVTAQGLCDEALAACEILTDLGFEDICLSLKASDPILAAEAYAKVAEACDFPLHLGVTEAGTLKDGLIKSTVGLTLMLAQGLGDTLRISLTADPLEEVKAAQKLLRTLGLRKGGPDLVACPTCGRTEVDLMAMAARVEEFLVGITVPLTVAVMGCPVNGPGEAKRADLGLAGGKDVYLLFRHGEIVAKYPPEEAFDALKQAILDYEEAYRKS